MSGLSRFLTGRRPRVSHSRGARKARHGWPYRGSPLRFEWLEDRTVLSTFLVDNLQDSGSGSLRAAIQLANANSQADTIVIAKTLAYGTINLQSALPSLTGVLDIEAPVIDSGPSVTVARANSDQDFRIFTISSEDANVTITGLNITQGKFSSDESSAGGGILNNGHLTLRSVGVIDNESSSSTLSQGGGIANNGYLSMEGCLVRGNGAGDFTPLTWSGDPWESEHWALIQHMLGGHDSVPPATGGGIYNRGVLQITDSVIDSNFARDGGGIKNDEGHVSLIRTTVSNNSSGGDGGGIWNKGQTSYLSIQDSNVFSNSANGYGGALYNEGTLEVFGSAFYGNDAHLAQGGGGSWLCWMTGNGYRTSLRGIL